MHPSKLISCIAALVFTGAAAFAQEKPQRIVSLNVCTDQFAMLLADPDQILSLSELSDDPFSSALAKKAAQFPKNSGSAEEIYLDKPDLVVGGIWTAQATVNMLKSLGIRVELFNPEASIEDTRTNLLKAGELFGQSERALNMVADFDAQLATLSDNITTRPRTALYSANGYTAGDQTLAGQILKAAGFANVADEVGMTWGGVLPLEQLVMLEPDLVVTGAKYPGASRAEEILDHPVLDPIKHWVATDAKWVCGTPLIIDAIKELQQMHPDKKE